MNTGVRSASIGAFQITGGTVSGTGTLTSSTAYDLQNGAVNVGLGGNVGRNKTGPGTVSLTRSLPGGNYTVSNGTLNTNGLSQSIGSLQITGGTVSGTGTLTSNAAYDVQGGTVNVKLAGTSIGLNKTGSGTAVLRGANTYSGLTTLALGTLELAPAAQNAVFNLGGADVQGGRLVFDYNGAASPAATIKSLLTNSYDGGLWDTGKFRSSTAGVTGLTLGWFDDGSSKVTVMATYAGDFNLDGVVDSQDMDGWTANFGMGTAWSVGDVNYDGVVNGLDYDLCRQNFGKASLGGDSVGDSSAVGVPEPGTLALLAAGLFGLLACSWRKRW